MKNKYRIVESDWIAPGIFETIISAPDIAEVARPGQFVNIYVPDGALLLPRPLSVADVRGTNIVVIYKVKGEGTHCLAELPAGATIEVMGPLGTGFFDYRGSATDLAYDSWSDRRRIIFLVAGGLGIPPMLFAARAIKAARHGRAQVVAFLGYPADPWFSSQLKVHTDAVFSSSDMPGRGDFTGTVTEMMEVKADDFLYARDIEYPPVLICGPEAMMAGAHAWCTKKSLRCRVSLEARMGCGYGTCRGCSRMFKAAATGGGLFKEYSEATKTSKKICVHGPVFWGDEIIWTNP